MLYRSKIGGSSPNVETDARLSDRHMYRGVRSIENGHRYFSKDEDDDPFFEIDDVKDKLLQIFKRARINHGGLSEGWSFRIKLLDQGDFILETKTGTGEIHTYKIIYDRDIFEGPSISFDMAIPLWQKYQHDQYVKKKDEMEQKALEASKKVPTLKLYQKRRDCPPKIQEYINNIVMVLDQDRTHDVFAVFKGYDQGWPKSVSEAPESKCALTEKWERMGPTLEERLKTRPSEAHTFADLVFELFIRMVDIHCKHEDVHIGNICFTKDEKLLKFIDVGEAKYVGNDNSNTNAYEKYSDNFSDIRTTDYVTNNKGRTATVLVGDEHVLRLSDLVSNTSSLTKVLEPKEKDDILLCAVADVITRGNPPKTFVDTILDKAFERTGGGDFAKKIKYQLTPNPVIHMKWEKQEKATAGTRRTK